MPALAEFSRSDVVSGLLYLVIFPSWLSYLLWNKGIQAIGATRGEIFSHIIPLSGGLFSVLFLSVPLHSFHLVSALLIVCGIALCSGKKAARTEKVAAS
ncbi:carboxylate/amino acid/amine transporter [Kluyvera cryocrescens]|uniref:Carboxylate/amino acid/amine transporter n=1 Tax=Kluyvera cryocrescens TaxID=580 RepID=A0A485AFN5_KLUCR|nr:carboxylate/amino acid/amine transporter [Kluyvera cryocrescens]